MVVKTDACAFTEMKVYPGKGRRFVTRTGQLVVLSGSKATAMYMQRKKPMLLRWTLAWRRNHKKLNVETGQKRKTRKVVRTVTRNFVGMTSDELKAKTKKIAAPKPAPAAGAEKAKVVQPAVAEAKAKAKAAQAERKKAGKTGAKMPVAAKHAGKGRT